MGGCPKPSIVTLENYLGSKRIITGKQRVAEGIKGRYIKNSKRYRSLTKRTLMKRSRRRGGGSEIVRPSNLEVVKKVKTLKKLVPNSSDSKGLDGLFRETADYILALQMRIQFMEVLVNGLSSTPADDIKIE